MIHPNESMKMHAETEKKPKINKVITVKHFWQ